MKLDRHLIFVGSGATASLGFKTTFQLGNYILQVCNIEEEAFQPLPMEEIDMIFKLLQGKSNLSHQSHFSSVYSFHVLQQCVKHLKKETEQGETIELLSLYNFLDMHISAQLGLHFNGQLIRKDQFIQARRLLDNLLTFRHQLDYASMNQENYAYYQDFARFLAKKMQKESVDLQDLDKRSREFYLFSYSIISMNWDPIFLWILFNSHREANQNPPYIGNPGRPVRLYHDFAHPMFMRKINQNEFDQSTWFPMNEGAVYRLNDERKDVSYFARLGKFYFPHGSHNFRVCESCGKLNIYLGDTWEYNSPTLFPPSVFLSSQSHRMFSIKEKNARKTSPDAQECIHCGEMTYMYQTDIVTQTSFKGSHNAYLEEIHRDMKEMIEKSNHLVLLGYSLPPDDVIYQSVLAAKYNNSQKITIVSGRSSVKGVNNEWVIGEDILKKFEKEDTAYKVYQSINYLFSSENIRAYAGYIPDVFVHNGKFSKEKALQIFNWQ